MQRLVAARGGLSKLAKESASCLTPSCGLVRLQHAKPEEVVDQNATHHNRQPSLSNSDSRLQVDSWGAVSSLPGQDPVPHLRAQTAAQQGASQAYLNHDGRRVDDGRYTAFLRDAGRAVLLAVWSI